MSTKIDTGSNRAIDVGSPAPGRAAPATEVQSIVTHRAIAASAERVWDCLQFYEEVDRRPPFLLRLLLPRPKRKVTAAAVEGEATTLPYEGGHYARRITKLDRPRRYEFEVIDQKIPSDRGVMLLSGAFNLDVSTPTQTDLSITTCYVSGIRPRWLAERVEAMLCRQLHRHLLDSIETKARDG
jgi:hypothetical protein